MKAFYAPNAIPGNTRGKSPLLIFARRRAFLLGPAGRDFN
jgi:hypothetical protein